MRFVARLASSPRVTTLELPRPSTRDDPPPSVDPPPTAAALDLSDALDDDDDTDRDGLGFFARAPASSRRRRAGISEKAHPKKVHRRRARPRARRRASAPTRARRRRRNPNHRSTTTTTTTPSRAVDSRRRARRQGRLIKAHGDRATSRRSSDVVRPRAARGESGLAPRARLRAVRRRFVYRRRGGATFDDARRRTVVRASELSVCPNRRTATIRKRPNSAFARGSRRVRLVARVARANRNARFRARARSSVRRFARARAAGTRRRTARTMSGRGKGKSAQEGHEPIRQGGLAIPGRPGRALPEGWQVRDARRRRCAGVLGGCHGEWFFEI